MVPLLREKYFCESEEPREISWPEYCLFQIEEASDALDFIREQADRCECLAPDGGVGRPLTDPKTLAKAVLIC
jgi:hypothetical protein